MFAIFGIISAGIVLASLFSDEEPYTPTEDNRPGSTSSGIVKTIIQSL